VGNRRREVAGGSATFEMTGVTEKEWWGGTTAIEKSSESNNGQGKSLTNPQEKPPRK